MDGISFLYDIRIYSLSIHIISLYYLILLSLYSLSLILLLSLLLLYIYHSYYFIYQRCVFVFASFDWLPPLRRRTNSGNSELGSGGGLSPLAAASANFGDDLGPISSHGSANGSQFTDSHQQFSTDLTLNNFTTSLNIEPDTDMDRM
jgi:hypothetical protein